MNNDPNETPFSKALLAGLLAGLLATMVCFAFDIAYRSITWFGPTEFINVSSIIFIVNLLLTIAGVIYFYIRRSFKKPNFIYVAIFALLTLFCLWKVVGIKRFTDYRLNQEFSQLLSGILLIVGTCAVLIPLLYNSKKLNEFVI